MSDLKIEVSANDGRKLLKLSGKIDDDSDYSGSDISADQDLIYDFEQVTLINSSGIQKWIKWFATIPDSAKIEFINCPLRIVTQMNLIPAFTCERPINVSSFYAPYFCESCDVSTNILMKTVEHFSDLNKIVAPDLPCKTCGEEMEFDGLEKRYFVFLKRQAA